MSRSNISARRGPHTRAVVAAVIGNGLEFFDFTILSYFVTTIGKLYFPGQSIFIQTLAMLSVVGVAYLMRPLGAVILGIVGDRRGRKTAMLWSLSLMTLGTVSVGLVPPYAMIGPLAPILLVMARLIQGFAAGGEVGVTTAYLVEIAPPHRRGLWSCWQLVSTASGVALGGTTGFLLVHSLAPADFSAWGWRLPFLFGVVLLPIGLYLRRSLDESLDPATQARSVKETFATLASPSVWPVVVLAGGVMLGQTVAANLNLYMVTYAQQTLHFPVATSMILGLLHGVILLVIGPLAALASDFLRPRNLTLILVRLVQMVVVFCAFWFFNSRPGLPSLIVGTAVMSIFFAASVAGMNVLIIENLPVRARTTAYSLINGITVSIFGGLAQPAVHKAIELTDNPYMPAWFISTAAAISIIALWFLKDVPLVQAESHELPSASRDRADAASVQM